MKNKSILLVAAISFLAASCGSSADEETMEVEATTYSLNTEASTLKWHGEENADHFHDGTISFTEGSFVMQGDEVVSGEFTIDPSTINPMTEGYPEEKMAYLKSHLMDTSFFFTAEYPTVMVTTGDYKDGKLSTTINVRGVDIATEVPVAINTTDDGVTIKGDFTIDFTKSKLPYLVEVDPETGSPGAKSTVDFKMDLTLSK